MKYIEATKKVLNSYPDDLEAGFLHADAIMTHSKWSYWRRDGFPLPRTLDAVAALEHVFASNRNTRELCTSTFIS